MDHLPDAAGAYRTASYRRVLWGDSARQFAGYALVRPDYGSGVIRSAAGVIEPALSG
jgi:hypothetical protein